MAAPLSLKQLTVDLALAYPAIKVHELPEDTPIFPGQKAWLEDQVIMVDGLPIFLRADQNGGRVPPGYSAMIPEGFVHDGFATWLALRGWRLFRWEVEDDNGQVHILLPAACVAADLLRDEPL